MHAEVLDWVIIAAFFGLIALISLYTRKLNRSVAGFLSAERCAGRYLLTISTAMAFCSAIGTVGGFEQYYRQGFAGQFWGGLMGPFWLIVSLSGWVIYRYRATRVLTMAQFLEIRYSRKFRVAAGFTAFVSGALNCAVFPMVTANFIMYFLGLPRTFDVVGIPIPTFHFLLVLLVGTAVLLATSGGQITVMVTDFFQGTITNVVMILCIGFVLYRFGWNQIIDTLLNSELVDVASNPEMIEKLERTQGLSMVNPFKIAGLKDFGVTFFLFTTILGIMQVGIWQGGQGYQTSARSPHEARMAGVLGGMRWQIIQMGSIALPIAAYVYMWNPEYAVEREAIRPLVDAIADKHIQSQMFVPMIISHILPAGLLGLFSIFMIGASISTDDSYYHSWGSILLQDVIMPLRKKQFTPEEHLRYLRISIIGMGLFALLVSSFFSIKEYIQMWFSITGAIYTGGAFCAVVGGLYWKRGTTAGAWVGLITGSTLSVSSIVARQIYGDFTLFGFQPNGLHISMMIAVTSVAVYTVVSLATCRQAHNMDKLLHRGRYAVEGEREVKTTKRSWWSRKLGVTAEFTRGDKVIYYGLLSLSIFTTIVFWAVAGWALTHEEPLGFWKVYWTYAQGYALFMVILCTIWFAIGGVKDCLQLFRDLKTKEVNEHDDGTVHGDHSAVDEDLGVP